jgi:ubiquitin C-terminal hydrolase
LISIFFLHFLCSYIVGLYNSGNSCFINAALQILLNCPTILGFFKDNCKSFVINRDKSGHNPNQPSISDQFMTLVEAVNNPEW